MQTFKASEDVSFLHNGDFSGTVIISVPPSKVHQPWPADPYWVKVEFSDILDFVAEFVRKGLITNIENMTTNDLMCLLGVSTKINEDDMNGDRLAAQTKIAQQASDLRERH